MRHPADPGACKAAVDAAVHVDATFASCAERLRALLAQAAPGMAHVGPRDMVASAPGHLVQVLDALAPKLGQFHVWLCNAQLPLLPAAIRCSCASAHAVVHTFQAKVDKGAARARACGGGSRCRSGRRKP